MPLPGPSVWPLAAAVATGAAFVMSIFTPWGVVVGAALLLPVLMAWGWPWKRPPEATRWAAARP